MNTTDPSGMSPEAALFLVVVGYFLPTLLAYCYRHKSAPSILVINLFLGWTIIGWVVALAWAVNPTSRKA